MENRKHASELAVFDSLLEGLASHAANSEVTSESFFSKTSQVIESILDSNWMAVVAEGPDDASILVHGSKGAEAGLASTIGAFQGTSKTFSSLRHSLKQSQESGNLVSEIQFTSRSNPTWGLLLVNLKGPNPTAVQQGVVDAIAETIEEHLRVQSRNQAVEGEGFGEDLLRFSINAHGSLDQRQVGYHLANDARLVLGCERVSVFSLNRNVPKLLAISSVASVERRSELAKNMTAMVRRAIQIGEPIVSDQKSNDTRLGNLLDLHLESSGFPFVFGVSLISKASKSNSPVGFLLAESTQDIDRVKFARGLSYVVPHAAISLANAKQLGQIPFRRTLSAIGGLTSLANISRMVIGLVIASLLVAILLWVPTEFKVRISGELRPVIERNVFAPQDGVVEKVFVNHGDSVIVGDPLIEIRSPDLELELEKATSDVKKLEKLKEAKDIALNLISSANSDPSLAAILASEISDINFQMATLDEKKKYLLQKRDELKISCPIAGQITTWQVKEKLTNRPVRWGDPMVNIAKLDGDWNLIFRVPERRIGYILKREDELKHDEKLEIDIFLESGPEKKFRVSVVSIDRSTVQDPELGPVTFIKCVAPPELLAKRQGATVSGDVDCGKKSIWFVWTREMTDAIRRRFVW